MAPLAATTFPRQQLADAVALVLQLLRCLGGQDAGGDGCQDTTATRARELPSQPLERQNLATYLTAAEAHLGSARDRRYHPAKCHNHVAEKDVAMRYLDLAPLKRSTVGFDRMFELLDTAYTAAQSDEGYPPFNIVRTGENVYRIEIAVAGFSSGDLNITSQENVLTVAGRKSHDEQQQYLHRGIAGRPFERRFNLADYLRVGSADLKDGLLTIELIREIPEAMRPRQIEIGAAAKGQKTIEQKAA